MSDGIQAIKHGNVRAFFVGVQSQACSDIEKVA